MVALRGGGAIEVAALVPDDAAVRLRAVFRAVEIQQDRFGPRGLALRGRRQVEHGALAVGAAVPGGAVNIAVRVTRDAAGGILAVCATCEIVEVSEFFLGLDEAG
jgi:hypothetical protein